MSKHANRFLVNSELLHLLLLMLGIGALNDYYSSM